MYELPVADSYEEQREKKWELVKGRSVELNVPEIQQKPHQMHPSKSTKTLKARQTTAEGRGKVGLPRSSTFL
jgi:hypothetical protein